MLEIPASHLDLVSDKTKAFAYLATLMEDGTPQVTPVWFGWNGEQIWINTARGRVKDTNMTERPDVAMTITNPDNPYRFLQIRGQVVESTTEGAHEYIDQLSMKYTGKAYSHRPGEVRVTYKIKPAHISAH